MTAAGSLSSATTNNKNNTYTMWSGLETTGMRDAKCSLLLQEEATHDANIKALPKQRVLVYQDKGCFNPAISSSITSSSNDCNGSSGYSGNSNEDTFYVDFEGATIMQLEPTISQNEADQPAVMPITLTVGGRCVFTPENFQDFKVMMRNKEQSEDMAIPPNGNFEWPDVNSLLLCPCCGNTGPIPVPGDKQEHEYWMVFYPLLQITVLKGSQMTLGTRTICRLTCVDCMEDMLEGLSLKVSPGGKTKSGRSNLSFTLPAQDILAEAGSASFLEDGPPRPPSHPHVDDMLDAWTLYNLWEHSGAWEALQNDYRLTLSKSMHTDSSQELKQETSLRERMGKPCGNPSCQNVHGKPCVDKGGEICRLYTKCRECHSEFYCSTRCRDESREAHLAFCLTKRRDREERREKRAKKVECDTCARKFPYTKMKKCSSCRNATYCSVDCQRMDWQRHKYVCKR